MTSTTRAQSTDVRFPLIVVDWAQDRHRYDSGWLQLVGPADLPQLQQNPTTQIWDGNGRPVTVHATTVTITSNASDPAVRNILLLWRSRVPVPVMPTSMILRYLIPIMPCAALIKVAVVDMEARMIWRIATLMIPP